MRVDRILPVHTSTDTGKPGIWTVCAVNQFQRTEEVSRNRCSYDKIVVYMDGVKVTTFVSFVHEFWPCNLDIWSQRHTGEGIVDMPLMYVVLSTNGNLWYPDREKKQRYSYQGVSILFRYPPDTPEENAKIEAFIANALETYPPRRHVDCGGDFNDPYPFEVADFFLEPH